MSENRNSTSDRSGVDRYVEADGGAKLARDDGAPGASAEAQDVFARCDAVMALTPKLAESADVAWAFAEARRLARSGPDARPATLHWWERLAVAWSAAGVAAVAALVLTVNQPAPPLAELPPPGPAVTSTNISFAPIIIPAGIENRLANMDPVVMLANELAVDGRSIAVLPFAGTSPDQTVDSALVDATAEAIYNQLMRQLAAIPGLYVIDRRTAAAYADVELSPREIARYLGVRGVVQGRVDTDGSVVSLGLRITDAAGDGASIERGFERPIAELAAIQTDIVTSVLDALGAPRLVQY